jgi:lambda family phage portal protein
VFDGLKRWFGIAPKAETKRSYIGAAVNRLNGDWLSSGALSADDAIRFNTRTLRDRARELVRNHANAHRFPQLVSENVIGDSGITLQARITSTRGSYHTALNGAIEQAWEEWGRTSASVDGIDSWLDLQRLIVETEAVDGEVLVRLVRGFPNKFGFALQVIDADLLDETYNVRPGDGQNAIKGGVEMDAWGRPIAYWLWTAHPSESNPRRTRERVPASEVIHHFDRERPGQTRGVTRMAAVITELHNLGEYRRAELMAARTAAAKMGFIKTTADSGALLGDGTMTPTTWDAEPGVIERLGPGEAFEGWDPSHPTSAFAEFDRACLRSGATGLGVRYSGFSGDYSQANYSSERAASLDERGKWQQEQQRLIDRVHRRVFRAWLQMASLSGVIPVQATQAPDTAFQWLPRRWPWVDPQKDLEAGLAAVAAGLTSLTRLAAEQGRDLEDVLRERQREEQLAASLGVSLTLGRPTSASAHPEIPPTGEAAPEAPNASDLEDPSRAATRRIALHS